MRATRRRVLRLTTALCAVALPCSATRAQGPSWPSKPLRIIVPGGPGGVTDIRARWLADRLSPALGQPILVDNRTGAGGNLGTVAAVRSPPDGYTLLIIHIGTMAINPHLYANPGYNPLTDIVPITRLGVGPQALAVHKDVPAQSVRELLSLAAAKPGELTFVSPGVGTPGHLAASLLMHLTGILATHVPYKGGAQAVQDLLAGHVTFTIESLTLLKPFVDNGRLRALAVTTPQRARSMPDLPTMAEAGVPGFQLTAWAGIGAPAGTPRPIVDRLYAEIAKILATPEARAWFDSFGIDPGGEPPDAFAALARAEYTQLGEVIRVMGIKAE
jgi:tripartite-type tricarboxylate transporter receptor subunit TctC